MNTPSSSSSSAPGKGGCSSDRAAERSAPPARALVTDENSANNSNNCDNNCDNATLCADTSNSANCSSAAATTEVARLERTARVVFLTRDYTLTGVVVELGWNAFPKVLSDSQAVFVRASMSSGRSRWSELQPHLCDDAQRMLNEANAGGSSERSEALAIDCLRTMFAARLRKTEMELVYTAGSKITDFSAELCGHVVGVSVTRAMRFRGALTKSDAATLLRKKLAGIVQSSANCANEQWTKQVLFCFCESEAAADTLQTAWRECAVELRANTVVLAVAAAIDRFGWIYYQHRQ